MALNCEQLTAQVGELRELYEQSRQEIVRRGQEHQSLHAAMESLRTRVDDAENKADMAIRNAGRSYGATTGVSVEVSKRLDRWATGVTDKPFQGPEGTVSLKEWVQRMKESEG